MPSPTKPLPADELEAHVQSAFHLHRLRLKLSGLDLGHMRALAKSDRAAFDVLYPPARVAMAATPPAPVAKMGAPASQTVPSPTTTPTEPVPDPKPAPEVAKAPAGVALPAPPAAEEARLFTLGDVASALRAKAKAEGRHVTIAASQEEAMVLLARCRGRGVHVPPPEPAPAPPEAESPQLVALSEALARRHGIPLARALVIAKDVVARARAGRRP
jgi:hypothetical protein